MGRENEWGDPQLVTTNVMENLRTVKQLSIEEKISFWQSVMQLATSRGIDLYFITWNICPNSVANPVEPFHKTFGIKWLSTNIWYGVPSDTTIAQSHGYTKAASGQGSPNRELLA